MIALTLPFPPTVNHALGQAGSRKYLKKSGHEFRNKVQDAVTEAQAKATGRLAVFVGLFSPTRRKYDIDNRIKSLLDALQVAGVYEDDEQVDVLWVVRKGIVKGGMCKVVIVPAENAIETYMKLERAANAAN